MGSEPSPCIEFSLHQRKRPVGSTGGTTLPMPAGPLPRITQVMALAISFQQMLRTGEAASYAAIARTAAITPERFSQVMKLIWLAPDIQQELLELGACPGRYPLTEHALCDISRHLPWTDQRRLWNDLKASLHLG